MLSAPVSMVEAELAQRTRATPDVLVVFLHAAFGLTLLGLALGALLPPDPGRPPVHVIAKFIDEGGLLRPEGKERTIFVALALASPATVLVCARLLRRRARARVHSLAAAALSLLAAFLVLGTLGPHAQDILSSLSVLEISELVALCIACSLVVTRPSLSRVHAALDVVTLSVAGLVIVALKHHALDELAQTGPDDNHFSAVVYAVAQSVAGKLCLVDYLPQYGCYGDMLAPVVRVLGSSLGAVSSSMMACSALGVLALFVWLRAVLRTRALVALALSAVVLLWIGQATHTAVGLLDRYYQYNPVRFLFPALALALGTLWRRPSPRLAAGFGAFAALALIWNGDTGVPVAGSLFAVMALDLLPRRVTGHGEGAESGDAARTVAASWRATLRALLAFALAFALCLLAFGVRGRLLGGHWPDVAALFRYADIFYVSGFNMVPMPLGTACWQVLAGVYLALLVGALVSRERDARARSVLQLGVLGIGLFAYYTGLSSPPVLARVSWPAVLGVAVLLDDAAWLRRAQEGSFR